MSIKTEEMIKSLLETPDVSDERKTISTAEMMASKDTVYVGATQGPSGESGFALFADHVGLDVESGVKAIAQERERLEKEAFSTGIALKDLCRHSMRDEKVGVKGDGVFKCLVCGKEGEMLDSELSFDSFKRSAISVMGALDRAERSVGKYTLLDTSEASEGGILAQAESEQDFLSIVKDAINNNSADVAYEARLPDGTIMSHAGIGVWIDVVESGDSKE